jgi:hypothetical protein
MSDSRRVRRQAERQAERLAKSQPDFSSRLIFRVRNHSKKLFAVLGLGGLLDLVKEHIKGKIMDRLLDKLGELGAFIHGYPVAFFSIGLILVLLWLLGSAVRESLIQVDSTIVGHDGKPFQIPRLDRRWTIGFGIVVLICLGIIGYTGYEYSRTAPLLSEFPLGYVIFETDSVTQAVMPLEVRDGFENFKVNFSTVRVLENTPTQITLQLPDIVSKESKDSPAFGIVGGTVSGDRISMQRTGMGYGFFDGKEDVFAMARVQKYEGNKITWVIGLVRVPGPRVTPLQ